MATVFGLLLIVDAVTLASGGADLLQVRPQSVDPWWMIALPLAGTLALHPWMLRFGAPEPRSRPPLHTVQILALAGALLVAPSVLLVQRAADLPLSLEPVLVCSVVLVVLGSMRMVLLVRRINTEAATDSLTGLPNRGAFYAAATDRLVDRRIPRALLLLDLNRFKDVNDALGHFAGDALLIQVAARIRGQVRRQDVLARLGGDEFAILLEDVGREDAQRAASAIVDALAVPFELDELAVHSGASIGISLFPEHASELSTLLRRSDIAMYQAKASGGHATYGGGAEDDDGRALWLAEEFRSALPARELVLHYQPKLDLATGEVRGVEALVRWNHPAHGLLYPATFLPYVHDAGLMHSLTQTVLALALDQAADWWANGTRLTVAVNLSASSLSDADLRREISQMVADRGLPASALRLEITEEFLMADMTQARVILGALCDAGISISVDDFGTGYSSLAYLRDLPIDELKLDMSFVSPMSTDRRAAALVASTIGLAHSLGLRIVAEGVEDRAAMDELTRLGCDEVQGFFVSRPLPARELDAWLAARAAVTHLPRYSRAAGLPTQANPLEVRPGTAP